MECNKSRVIPGEEIFRTFLNNPIAIIMQFFESLARKELTTPINNMVWRRGSIHKLQEFIRQYFTFFQEFALHIFVKNCI